MPDVAIGEGREATAAPARAPRPGPSPALRATSVVLPLALLGTLLALPQLAGPFVLHIFILTFFTAALGVSYRPLLVAGQVSIVHGTLYAIGAYVLGILAVKHGVAFVPAVIAAGLIAVVASILIGLPSLRTAGAYFFLVTFAFSVVVLSLIENFPSLTGGFSGISGIPYPPGISNETDFFYLVLAAAAVVLGVFVVLDRSRWGLELRGLGGSPELAESVGVWRLATLLAAFAVGAFFAGMLGAFYASYIGFIAPQSFELWLSVSILTAAIVGGARYAWGPAVGAALITLVPETMQWQGAVSAIFGGVLVIATLMLFRRGIATEATDWIGARFGGWTRTLGERAAASRPAAPAVPHPEEPLDAGPGEVLLAVEGLDKSFGGVHAVDGVSFEVRSREVLGLIGPNGSGKTTTFNLISGFARADAGRVELAGASIARALPHRIVRHGLARSFQASATFEELTVLENVALAAAARGRNPVTRLLLPLARNRAALRTAWEVLELVGLADRADLEAGGLPYGEKKILGLAIALATRPRLLCLDEPATGMSDAEIAELIKVLRTIRARHEIALVIIEHRLAVIRELCDRVVALRSGALLMEGTPEEVLSHPEVIEAYLGGGDG
ncbi:MAG TPA: branched-chain amino acid ABC transporter ATP-binding protein/permease [Solirubrobacterales bacterium]|jgi:branched-chain amino acid transport system permease protein